MAKTSRTKGFEKLSDPEKYLVAGSGDATHQTGDAPQGSLTTNQGVVAGDKQNTLKSGGRGPLPLEDFAFREKITRFDHERIPERIVHARGSGAHGYFEVANPIPHLTKARFLAGRGKKTEVFARFSTVAGGAGAGDMPREVRGFAVKFYTDEGNFHLVGNNIPVFFIQDASIIKNSAAVDWIRGAFGHLKVIGYTATAKPTFQKAIADDLDDGVIELDGRGSTGQYIEAARQQRVWDREARLSESDA
jgi:hypothetical protein